MADITVFTARSVRTMEPSMPTAEAVAVRDGRIVEVGTLETLRPWLDRCSQTNTDRQAQIDRYGYADAARQTQLDRYG